MTQDQDASVDTKPGLKTSQDMVAQIVAAYAQRPDVGVEDIVRLTRELTAQFAADSDVGAVAPASTATDHLDPLANPSERRVPAVALDQAVQQDSVTCLCCGKSFKTLKRHLMSAHGMTEADYRAAFDLPADFPIVAPSYSDRRSEVASSTGFGTYDRSGRGARDVA